MPARIATAAALAAVTLVSGCATMSATAPAPGDQQNQPSTTPVPASQPLVTFNVVDSARVPAGKKVTATASHDASIDAVRVNDVDTPTESAHTWTSSPLPPSRPARIDVTVTDTATGARHTITRTVKTAAAKTLTRPSFNTTGTAVGVGYIPTVTYPVAVPKKQRTDVAAALTVTGTPAVPAGRWRWLSDTTLAYRTDTFFPAHSTVTITAAPLSAPIKSGSTMWWPASAPASATWAYGRALVTTISATKHSGVATVDGKVARKFKVSTGKSGYVTRSGIKTLTDKHRVQRMTNQGVTNDEVYDLQVPYAIRLTETGEFLHAAPWNSNIGYANTSHGCTNLRMGDAKWFYSRARTGDPVTTTGTSRRMETDNGPGALWNITFDRW